MAKTEVAVTFDWTPEAVGDAFRAKVGTAKAWEECLGTFGAVVAWRTACGSDAPPAGPEAPKKEVTKRSCFALRIKGQAGPREWVARLVGAVGRAFEQYSLPGACPAACLDRQEGSRHEPSMVPLTFVKVEDPVENRWVEPSGRYVITSEFGSRDGRRGHGKYFLRLDNGKHLLTAFRMRDVVERATEHRDRTLRLGYNQIEDVYPPAGAPLEPPAEGPGQAP